MEMGGMGGWLWRWEDDRDGRMGVSFVAHLAFCWHVTVQRQYFWGVWPRAFRYYRGHLIHYCSEFASLFK